MVGIAGGFFRMVCGSWTSAFDFTFLIRFGIFRDCLVYQVGQQLVWFEAERSFVVRLLRPCRNYDVFYLVPVRISDAPGYMPLSWPPAPCSPIAWTVTFWMISPQVDSVAFR